ncbi:hypothetical protein [Flavobacterium sp.]|uniref:COG4705 family protein n=1 Tax=Flavobacterium sp. TaxID=239 RepID=UPI002487D292|nr:hypothetical protein [Flavobacterium sp.]MDI1318412.1 hypothetical protein [Flavobacterium sp.]
MKKIPEITMAFWIMKICATTLGETAGDLFSMTLNIGYAVSSLILIGFFIVTLQLQLYAKKYNPLLYWFVILATSTAGTTISDFMDRTLGLGYANGSLLLASLLILTLFLWRKAEKSISVNEIHSFRGEVFYWIAILVSNTLGTALGDFLADDSGLGFLGGALLIGVVLVLITLTYFFSNVSRIVLFWLAFILTRPFGATFGDLLTKPYEKGGLNFGTIGSSALLFILLITLIVFSIIRNNKQKHINFDKKRHGV